MPALIDHAARRRALGEAAWRVILRSGVDGVSLRTVAAEAGVSAGSLRHVLPSTGDVLAAALDLVYERVMARVLAIDPAVQGRDRGLAIAAELLPLDDERRAEFAVQLALVAASLSQPALAAIRDEADGAVHHAARRILLLSTGAEPPEAEVTRLHALLDGLALHLLYRTDLCPADALDVVTLHLTPLKGTPHD